MAIENEGNILDRVIMALAPERGLRRIQARVQAELGARAYRGASRSRLFKDWVGQDEEPTPDPSDLKLLRNRSRDANRNFALAAGVTGTMGMNIVGHGLRPQPTIRAERLGLSEERAEELRDQAEDIWELWSKTADSANIMTGDEIQFLAITKVVEDGEAFALPVWANDPWREIKRAVEVVEADAIDTPPGRKTREVQHGIEYGKRGEPTKFHIKYHDGRQTKYREIKPRDAAGRPNILHVFPTKRPNQKRGIPFIAPVLPLFKHMTDYVDALVIQQRVAACLGVFVTKQNSYGAAIRNASTTRESVTNARLQRLYPGMIGYLEADEDVKTINPNQPGDQLDAFITNMVRQVGLPYGMPYEMIMKDFSKTNYSSARAAILEARRAFLFWRHWFAQRFCQVIYELVLEEAYLRGLFQAPDWERNKRELVRAAWIGPAWGWVDPVKEVDSAERAVNANLSTLSEEAGSQGRKWKEIIKQRQREKEYEKRFDVEPKGNDKPKYKPDEEDEND